MIPCLVPVLVAAALCQGPGRPRLQGFVRDAAGKPVPNAAVVLVARPVAALPGFGRLDRIEAETDARGRFRVRLSGGLTYTCTATWTAGDGPHGAKVVDSVGPGTVRLTEPKGRFQIPKFRVTKREAWKDRAPLSFTLQLPGRVAIEQPLEVDADGAGTLPFLPHSDSVGSVWVHGADGEPIHMWPVATGRREATAPRRFAMPEPKLVEGMIKSPAGKPVAGATIHAAVGSSSRRVFGRFARSGVDGKFRARIPSSTAIHVDADGYERFWTRLVGGRLHLSGAQPKQLEGPAVFVLKPEHPLEGRILGFDGKPIAGVPVLVHGQPTLFYNVRRNSWTSLRGPFEVVATGAGGSFAVPMLTGDCSGVWVGALLPSRVIRTLAEQLGGFPEPPALLPLRATFERRNGKPEQVPTFSLATRAVARFQIRAPDGVFARGARVFVTGARNAQMPVARTDRRGRSAMLVEKGSYMVASFAPEHGWVADNIDVGTSAGRVTGVIELTMQPFEALTGRVIGPSGEPVAGTRIRATGWSQRGSIPYRAMLGAANNVLLTGTTDAEGRFRLHFIGHPARTTNLSFQPPRASGLANGSYQLRSESESDVEIALSKR